MPCSSAAATTSESVTDQRLNDAVARHERHVEAGRGKGRRVRRARRSLSDRLASRLASLQGTRRSPRHAVILAWRRCARPDLPPPASVKMIVLRLHAARQIAHCRSAARITRSRRLTFGRDPETVGQRRRTPRNVRLDDKSADESSTAPRIDRRSIATAHVGENLRPPRGVGFSRQHRLRRKSPPPASRRSQCASTR